MRNTVDTIRVLLVDDHAIVRQGLRLMLETRPQLQIVGEAADAESALQKTRQLQPDLVLMDLLMPGSSAVECIRQIRALFPDIRILVLSSSTEDQLIKQALQAGAHGYMLKASRPADLLHAIEQVMSGGSAIDSLVGQALVRQVQNDDLLTTLTPRERAVFD